MKTFAVANQKGGVAMATSIVDICHALAESTKQFNAQGETQ